MRKSSLILATFDLLKTVIMLVFIRLRNFLMIRLCLLSFFMRFTKINRAMKKCQTEISKTLKSLGELDNVLIAHVREAFEETETGKQTVRTNPNRRPYAVLIPTKEENIQRIKNVFDCMNYEEKALRLAGVGYILPSLQNINYVTKKMRKLYRAGKISKYDAIETIKQSVSF